MPYVEKLEAERKTQAEESKNLEADVPTGLIQYTLGNTHFNPSKYSLFPIELPKKEGEIQEEEKKEETHLHEDRHVEEDQSQGGSGDLKPDFKDIVLSSQPSQDTRSESEEASLKSLHQLAVVSAMKKKNMRFCTHCLKFKPDRTHHCRQCGRCVLKMDHHCPWLSNCIGFRNHKFFMNMLIYGSKQSFSPL